MRIRSLAQTVLAALVGLSATAQTVKVDPKLTTYKKVSGISGNLNSVGSDTLNNLMADWVEGFNKKYPNVKIQVEGKGSTTAPPALIESTSQLGPMSREMKNEEADKFEKKFYGIEPGNDGNKIVQAKIDDPANGLQGWELVESSEQGMLAQAQKSMKKQEWIAFLGWTPHPVMGKMELVYLTGFENDGFGDAQIKTLTRAGYSAECANVGKLLSNLKFELAMESAIMEQIDAKVDGEVAAADWLKANPAVLDTWLAGVTTTDGQDGAAAVKKSLGL